MKKAARVSSISAIADFRVALAKFRQQAQDVLDAAQLDARRMIDWTSFDQPAFWKQELRRRHERLLQAKSELSRRRSSKITGEFSDCTEQLIAVRRFERQVAEAEQKMQRCQLWSTRLQHALNEYEARGKVLANMLDADVTRSMALLGKLADILDSYVQLAPASPESVSQHAGSPESAARGGEGNEPCGDELPKQDSEEAGPKANA